MIIPSIITHRGLDPDIPGFPDESSLAAFEAHLARGYGIEFDLAVEKGCLVVRHGNIRDHKPSVPLESVLRLIKRYPQAPISALHYKGKYQNKETTKRLLETIDTDLEKRLLIFDVAIDTAIFIKEKRPHLLLAPSVAHPYDIERYNGVVHGTLVSIGEAIGHRDLFDWIWLDEWDRKSEKGRKKLYTKENFALFRESGFKIAVVSPELHATSPGLLGGESHEDADDISTLKTRLEDIISLRPDAICTDHPDMMALAIKKTRT